MAICHPSRLTFLALSIGLVGCGAKLPAQPQSGNPAAGAAASVGSHASGIVQVATPEQMTEALAHKADVGPLDQLAKRPGVGAAPEDQAPPNDLLLKTLPGPLDLAEAQKLLIAVPSSQVVDHPRDRHTDFLGPYWGAPFLSPFMGLGFGPLPFAPFDAFAASYFFPYAYGPSTFFFPYAFAGGLFYPSFCPFYFSMSAFLPYCQPPLVYFGTGIPPIAPPLGGMVPPGPIPPLGGLGGVPPYGAAGPVPPGGMPPYGAAGPVPPMGPGGIPGAMPGPGGIPGAGMMPGAGPVPGSPGAAGQWAMPGGESSAPNAPSSAAGGGASTQQASSSVTPASVQQASDLPPGPGAPYGPVPPYGPGAPYGPVPPMGPGPLAGPPMPLTPLPVTVAEGMRPLIYVPGEVPVL